MGTIFEKLDYLKETKTKIASAIEECNVTVPDNSTFFSFGNLIRQIQGQFNKYHNTKPTTYTSAKENSKTAVSPINTSADKIDVDDGSTRDTPSIIVYENGVYTPDSMLADGELDHAVDGFANVLVKVGFTESIDPNTYTVRFYDGNDLLYTDKVPKLGTAHFGGILPSKSNKIFAGWDPSTKSIKKDTDVHAVWNDETSTSAQDLTDVSWEEICANGGADYPIGSYKELNIGSYEYISNRYSMANNGNMIENPNYWVTIPQQTFIMRKVYAGEDGTSSTWISDNASAYSNVAYDESTHGGGYAHSLNGFIFGTNGDSLLTKTTGSTDRSGECRQEFVPSFGKLKNKESSFALQWGDSKLRSFLNSTFIEKMPECLQKAITPVVKYTSVPANVRAYGIENGFYATYARSNDATVYGLCGINGNSRNTFPSYLDTIDGVWIPSVSEMKSYNSSTNNTPGVHYGEDPGTITSSLSYRDSNYLSFCKGLKFRIGFCLSAIGSAATEETNNEQNNGEENNNGTGEQGQETQGS